MFKGFYDLTSGMLTQGRRLDVISNNMTNVATAGFKTDRFTYSTFQEVMWSRTGNKNKNYTELGTQSFITAPSQLYTDFEQSSFDETYLPLDFAIEGDGFFAVETGAGRRFTRNGNFSLDDEGYLCLPAQGRVLNAQGQPIQLVNAQGQITDKLSVDDFGGLFTETGEPLGRIGVFTFEDTAQLEKDDQGMFTAPGNGQGVFVRVHNGMLERSNVDLAQQMVEMITSQRSYQSIATVTKMYDEVMNKATTDIGRL